MITPTLEQQAILASPLGPMRIAAGAGTGKTTTVALLVANLVEDGVEPEEILGLTFTQKAAAELTDRTRTMVSPLVGTGREPDVHTYHGFAAQFIREFGALVGIERDTPVITPTFVRQLLLEIMQNRRFEHVDVTWSGVVDRVHRLGSALGDHLADPADLIAAAGEEEPWPERLELLGAWQAYQAEKQRLGIVDYSDLISASVDLLARQPGLITRVRSRYRVVLLDEYQDTNPAQRILLQILFGDGFPVVAVGDSDQTIYEWRGATPDNFDSFPDHFRAADGSPARDRHLTLNRRSDQRILDVANAIKERIGGAGIPLSPLPDAGGGHVGVRWASDAVTEAGWIAERAIRHHEDGVPWNEMAVLFRKNRHISLVHDAFVERGIPVEVANLGGLLSVPEVADVRAWMRLVHSPEDGPALLRILMGPRYRLGMGDLVHLTRWAGAARPSPEPRPEVSIDHEGVPAHTMLEAVDHLDQLEGLDSRTDSALRRFREEYRRLLEFAQSSSLSELTRTILDVTGMWRDVEAMDDAARLTARLNLYRFLDLTEEWSPLEGRPSLPAFLAHLELMDDNPADELDAARLSGEEAVAMLTVHRAKGLEWDVVFVPAVAKQSFPAKPQAYEDPYRRAQWLPHEWRRDEPPPFDATTPPDEAKKVLAERHQRQEWRTAYVAVTRARRILYVSGAHWYGVPTPTKRPSAPSELFELVASSPVATDHGHDAVPDRPEILRAPDRLTAPDPLFPDGWAAALREAAADPGSVSRRAGHLGIEDAVEVRAAEFTDRLFAIDDIPAVATGPAATASVTGLVSYAACPRQHYWSEVDRLPRRPSAAARRGVEVHRRIELHALGQVPFRELDPDAYDLADDADAPPRSDPYSAFLRSGYAERRPLLVEAGFEFPTDAGISVRGRIDAVYPSDAVSPNGQRGWEIVDFKTGRRRDAPWRAVQLQAYAVAARRVDFGIEPPETVTVTFVYLGDGVDIDTRQADAAWETAAESSIEEITAGIAEGRFDPRPSPACRSCEFTRFCEPGRAWLKEHPDDP